MLAYDRSLRDFLAPGQSWRAFIEAMSEIGDFSCVSGNRCVRCCLEKSVSYHTNSEKAKLLQTLTLQIHSFVC